MLFGEIIIGIKVCKNENTKTFTWNFEGLLLAKYVMTHDKCGFM